VGGLSHRAPSLPALPSPSQDQRILQSIYNISMSLRDAAGGALRGPEEAAVWKVVRDTEFVLRENCRRIGKVRASPLPHHPAAPSLPPCAREISGLSLQHPQG